MTTPAALQKAGPSWYDVLGVDPTATGADVRTAWKQAIADLDPGDRRFGLLNQAAEVLLDHDRRAAYDAALLTAELDAERARTVEVEAGVARSEVSTSGEPEPTPTRVTGWVVPGWLPASVAVIAAVVVAACVVVAATAPSDASIEAATREAQAAAERAIVPVLSYDGSKDGDLEADQRLAEGLMTTRYRERYAQLFEVVKANAPRTGTTVTAEVVASGIVRSGGDRVALLLFVDRPTTNKQQKEPVVYRDQVTVTMQKVGDTWLVDDLVTSPAS